MGQAVAVDSKGNAIFVGEYEGMTTFGGQAPGVPPGAGANVFVVKLDPTGAVLWAKSFGGDGYEIGISVAVGEDDTIVLTGMYSNSMTFGGDVLTVRRHDKQRRRRRRGREGIRRYYHRGQQGPRQPRERRSPVQDRR
jgi:hypothetical protein